MTRIFDSHLHIIDPRFPLIPNQGYLPSKFTCNDYYERMKWVDVKGGAVVSGSFQGFDQTYLKNALQLLGPSFVGVTQLPATISDKELIKLNNAGIRAVRFNLHRGGSVSITKLDSFANRIYSLLGWHVELYVDSENIGKLFDTIIKLPSVSIDHLGLSRAGLREIYRLAEQGVRIKATGFGRLDFPALEAIKQIYELNPAALIFGTDLPSTRAPKAYTGDDLRLITENFPPKDADRILYGNARRFYRLN